MSMDMLIAWYVVLVLGLVSFVAFLQALRWRRVEWGGSHDQVFRCEKCNYVYTDDPSVERSRCPQCGRTNSAFEF